MDHSDTMFQRLQEFPLLIGLSKGQLMHIVETMDFDFRKLCADTPLAVQGERCARLIYLLTGTLEVKRLLSNTSIEISEQVSGATQAPYPIEPCNLWGMKQLFTHTYTLTTAGSVCILRKQQVATLIAEHEVVRTNMLSVSCNAVQRAAAFKAMPFPSTPTERLQRFILLNTLTASGPISIASCMTELAAFLGISRLALSTVLHKMADEELLTIERRGICIPDVQKILVQ